MVSRLRLMSLPVYIIRRILFAIPLILGITLISFIIANAIPADPINANLPQNALNDPELVTAFRERWGLDKSPVEQYFTYLGNLLQGRSGRVDQDKKSDFGRYQAISAGDDGVSDVLYCGGARLWVLALA